MKIDIDQLSDTSQPLNGNCPGVYFLFDGDEIVYIGKGWNCLLRVAEHTRKETDKVFTSWNYIPVSEKVDYTALEKELIMKYRPKYNKTHNKSLSRDVPRAR